MSTLATATVHVEDGKISSVDEGANELSVPCSNDSSSNRLEAGNSRDDWELQCLVVEDKRQEWNGMRAVF